MPLPLDLLRYFVAVAEELHFGSAAERLRMTQPPLSQRIRQLESSLQAELFTRTTRSVRLTAAGEVLLERARSLLQAAQEAEEATQRAAHGQTGCLRLGFTSGSAYRFLPGVLSRFTAAWPAVSLQMSERVSVELLDDLRMHRIDVALLRLGALQHDADLSAQAVHSEPMLLALGRGHPLQQRKTVAVRDLDGVPLVGFSATQSPYFRAVLEAIFHRAGVRPRLVTESVLPTMLALVEAGIGLALVPASAAVLRAGELVYRPLRGAGPQARAVLHCVTRTREADPVVRNFIAAVRAHRV
ncbi:LysR substrate-binding domain-containing protein [Ramlibacter sp. AN1015]|uniref:LysR family transcriptional regulator n=1 Tax=Ramlibacter sp. AN1015 TaxID=3133428 RepID=UPI0030C23F78